MDKEIKEMLKNHDERIKKLEQIAKETKKTLDEHSKTLAEHSKILEEHTEILNSLQRSMVIIEDAVVNKIPALFDGYSMHQEKQEQLETRVEKLEEVSQMHSARLIVLENNFDQRKTKLSS